jgi:peptidoglycan/xylan/chitin deacetylase (PgdA/CDA1 family)
VQRGLVDKMKNKNIFFLMSFFIILLVGISSNIAFGEETQKLEIEIKYTNGDRIDAYQTNYVVYQDNDKNPFLEEPLQSNPQTLVLPKDHRYKIEVFVNGMYSEVGYTELHDIPQKLDIQIPLPGGLKFNVFFEDGETPVQDATVIIKSQDGVQQRIASTNENGETMRYWLQSTILPENHYTAEVYFEEFLLTSVSDVKVFQGISQDQKITVPIPSVVEELIVFRLYDTDSQKLLKSDGDYSVLLVDSANNSHIGHITGQKGEVYFSSLPSGVYSVSVLNNDERDPLWKDSIIIISGNQNNFDLIQTNPITLPKKTDDEISTQNDPAPPIDEGISFVQKPVVYQQSEQNYKISCNCVSFRLDDVQDYWLNEIQAEIIKKFSENEIPLTSGVIIDSFGNDSFLLEIVQNEIKNQNLEIANHGLDSTPLTVFDKEKQNQILKESNIKIKQKLGVNASTLIPPQNRFNEDTLDALRENGFTHLSASTFNDSGPFPLKDQKIYRFPEVATTGEYVPSQNRFVGITADKTFSDIVNGLNAHGFAVVTMHPQEFSVFRGGEYVNEIDEKQFQELDSLIEKIKNSNFKTVYLGDINENISIVFPESQKNFDGHYVIPSWIKNNAGWWRDGFVDDESFILSMQFLIQEDILQLPPTAQGHGGTEIPDWIKDNAGWWAEGKISDDDFVYGVNYLVSKGIIVIDI